jgi:hypothetical protein|tara:strand:+ start:889 stop:1161 length:273 start_codon:yes stop_codon:yes gene_type:complete
MNLGILWHGDFTITVHDTDCRDFHKPRKERSSGLESGIIIGCTALLDKKIHKKVSDHQALFDYLDNWLHTSDLGETKLEYMNCTNKERGI